MKIATLVAAIIATLAGCKKPAIVWEGKIDAGEAKHLNGKVLNDSFMFG